MKTITYNPETHRLAPIEPTIEMVVARIEYSKESPYKYHETTIEGQYHAMLSAAPQPEPVEVEPVAKVDMSDEGLRADILHDRSVKLGQLLYTAPPDYEEIKRQRDELLAAIEIANPVMDAHAGPSRLASFNATVASVKGGAA